MSQLWPRKLSQQIAFVILATCLPATSAVAGTIDVALLFADSFELAAEEPIRIKDGAKLSEVGRRVRVSSRSGTICIDRQCQSDIDIETDAAFLTVGTKRYPPFMRVVAYQGKAAFVARLDVEVYLEGVLGKEMSPSWPLAALEAQAVVARTFAYRKKQERSSEPFHLKSTHS